MGKRIMIKTALICFGIFLIIGTLAASYILKKYPLDTEPRSYVLVASTDIGEGTVLEEKHIKKKLIHQSALNGSMVADTAFAVGRKTVHKISANDYLRAGDLIERKDWYEEDDRIIVLPVSVEERLANLVCKGSYVDIRLIKENVGDIETVISKVRVEDVLDEAGNSLSSNKGTNSRTAYMKLILNEPERLKVYAAAGAGRLIYELYCSET